MAPRLWPVALVIAISTGARADCADPAWAVSFAPQRSVWQEFDASRHQLVREAGTLRQVAVRVSETCGSVQVSLDLTHARGARDYDGIATNAVPITSTSRIVQTELQLQAMAPVSPALALGTRLAWHRIRRDLAGVGAIQGYPERYTYWLAHAGAGVDAVRRPDWLLRLEGWLSAGPGGQLDLNLPNADPTRLELGRGRGAELALQVGSAATPADASWNWLARLAWIRHDIAAGPVHQLTRNGAIFGGALQPRIRHSEIALRFEMSARF